MKSTLLSPVEAAPSPPAYPTLKESWAALGWLVLITLLTALAVVLLIKAAGYFTGAMKLVLTFSLGSVGLLLTLLWLRRRAGSRRWWGTHGWQHPGRWHVYALGVLLVIAQDILLSGLSFLHLPNWYRTDFQSLDSHPL